MNVSSHTPDGGNPFKARPPASIPRMLAQAKQLYRAGNLREAEQLYWEVLLVEPNSAEANHNLGGVLAHQNRVDEAAVRFRKVIDLEPGNAEALHNLAVLLVRAGRLTEALDLQRQVVALRPTSAVMHVGLGGTLLMLGQLLEGWPEYEWRLKLPGARELERDRPRWAGEPLAGRTILIDSEQAYGDTLQFIRYALLLKQQGARVVVECLANIETLLARTPGVDQVVIAGRPLPDYDVHIPLASLPSVFRTTLADIPSTVPYLAADPELAAHWQRELGNRGVPKVGLAWQGNPGQAADRDRSFPLALFAPLVRTPGVEFYSLQAGAGREQLAACNPPLAIVDLGDRLGDFHNTAAIMSNLDLVITVDSAPAHLAGGLGLPVWMPLPAVPDWRWLLHGEGSPWYPTMRVFRQTTPGDWSPVFANVEQALRQRLA